MSVTIRKVPKGSGYDVLDANDEPVGFIDWRPCEQGTLTDLRNGDRQPIDRAENLIELKARLDIIFGEKK